MERVKITGHQVMAITFVSVLMCNLVMGSTVTASSRYPVFFAYERN